MRRKLAALLLAGVCLLLCACGAKPQAVTADKLSMTVPGSYADHTADQAAAGYTAVFGRGDQAVTALKEPFTVFEKYGLELDLEGYTQLVLDANGVTGAPQTEDGLTTFTMSQNVEGQEYTYLSAVYEGSDAFWLVQCGCRSEIFKKNRNDFLEILKTVTVG